MRRRPAYLPQCQTGPKNGSRSQPRLVAAPLAGWPAGLRQAPQPCAVVATSPERLRVAIQAAAMRGPNGLDNLLSRYWLGVSEAGDIHARRYSETKAALRAANNPCSQKRAAVLFRLMTQTAPPRPCSSKWPMALGKVRL